jgi:hypothetical protein
MQEIEEFFCTLMLTNEFFFEICEIIICILQF